MTAYDAKCPYCGHLNTNLYLEETGGWMECEMCGKTHQFIEFEENTWIPLFEMDHIPKDYFDRAKPVA